MISTKVLPFKSRPPIASQSLRVVGLPVMLVGKDPELLQLRHRVIEDAGFTVRSLSPDAAEAEVRSPKAGLWVFCNTIQLSQLVNLAYNVHRSSPRSRLLLIEGLRPIQTEACLFDKIVRRADGIDEMLRKMREVSQAA